MGEKEDALTKTYDLMLWLFPHIGKFPRDYRFILLIRFHLLPESISTSRSPPP